MSNGTIVLDVGGTLFKTLTSTLFSVRGSRFDTILSGTWLPQHDGSYFLDLDPTYFGRVLNHLRGGASLYPGLGSWEETEIDRLRMLLRLDITAAQSTPTWDYLNCDVGLLLVIHARVVAIEAKVPVMRYVRTMQPCDQYCVRLTANGRKSDVVLDFTSHKDRRPQYQALRYDTTIPCWRDRSVQRDMFKGTCLQDDNPHNHSFPLDVDLLVTWHRESRTLSIACEGAVSSMSFPATGFSDEQPFYPTVGLLRVGRWSTTSHYGPGPIQNTSIEAHLRPLPGPLS
ncbi:hypothetical protein SDRG_02226 [Saprolegnia diclina VS20]|uniref:Potassium channel tetramerisation-type BTB domain-containing protein n=1 Tax=Saprolegnia diclina (strain VS20) TaxID=1156394 RepID=T0R1V1_SAPDV|nr:hypothetical protein SDRG_02226 [Saprolegnia diclina VS20]EQC40325.1 hypothetical protein SDRG_02226 [Saprolegnia diclina VS20]|eukprot:XP_008606024.1 hypothetical protein SDRG_02226 [Saprolegnia diclina VS20]